VLKENQVPEGVFSLVIGQGSDIGEAMAGDTRLPLISATGSTRMGKSVAKAVAARLGKSLLELGGNNAIILSPHANLRLAIPAIVFGAVGTCGQRCTTTRRLLVHESLYETVVSALKKAYEGLRIGNPLDAQNHVGPLIDQGAVVGMQKALGMAEKEGGKRIWGGKPLPSTALRPSSFYVEPAIVSMPKQSSIVREETFAPILYVLKYSGDIQVAIDMQNDVPQGLSSALFSDRLQETEQFLAAGGSDCGIANVNLGTSGAEIGGAFGGEKETGGGRESGSDSWKAYMRRQTNTINFSNAMPLAQGIRFEL
jgi:aldehyde dehydrogenase (NAD+)